MFREIKGQSAALRVLNAAIDNDRVSHAYLFHGIDGVGKSTAALYFGMALNCLSRSEYRPCGVCSSCRKFLAFEHPDLLYVFPSSNLKLSIDGEIQDPKALKEYKDFIRKKIEAPWEDFRFSTNTMIRLESMRWLIKRLSLTKYEASKRICLIEDADQMNIETSNAFLKTLEEPPGDTVIILTTNNLSKLLPTIVSRCQTIYFKPVAPQVVESILMEKFNVSPQQARTASHIADGSVKRAIHLVQGGSFEIRDRAFEIFRMAVQGEDLAYFNSIHNPPSRPNAESAIELLRYLSLFAGDLNLVENAPEQVVNIDKMDFLRETKGKLDILDAPLVSDRIMEFISDMERYIRMIGGNVNLQLILLNLYPRLARIFRG